MAIDATSSVVKIVWKPSGKKQDTYFYMNV